MNGERARDGPQRERESQKVRRREVNFVLFPTWPSSHTGHRVKRRREVMVGGAVAGWWNKKKVQDGRIGR